MTQILSSLKIVSAKPQFSADPLMLRRQKLIVKLNEQLAMAKAMASGETYAVKRLRSVKDESGVVQTVEVSKRLRPWWYQSQNGKVAISLRYGSRVIDLAKGKNAVEVANSDELIGVIGKLIAAVDAGELDQQISSTADAVRARVNK